MKVLVANGSSVNGAAGTATDALEALGYVTGTPANTEAVTATVIYFTEEVRDALHERLVKALAPGGYLIVGTSERVADPRGLGLTSPFHFIYRKS